MAYKYNPLLKDNLQQSDTAAIENLQQQVDQIKQNKITKCLTAAELAALYDGEIFQWQGQDTTVDGTELKNGFFYKKGGTVIPANTFYFNYNDSFNTALFSIPSADYYYKSDSELDYAKLGHKQFNNIDWFFVQPCAVGNPIVSETGDIAYITAVENNLPGSDTEGHDWTNINFYNTNGLYKIFSNFNGIDLFVALSGDSESFKYVSFFCIQLEDKLFPIPNSIGKGAYKTNSEIILSLNYTQTDTQPSLAGITEDPETGEISISRNTTFAGDVTVQGTQTTVITQEIDSENDNINLRYNNPLAIADGAESGVKVLNYDGNGTNSFLGVDNQGWARIGDENGTLQKLATIEENPTNGALVKYNTNNKQLESTTISAATQSAAGLMSAADKTKLDGIATGANAYTLPTASSSTLGGVKVGTNLSISNGVLSATDTKYNAATQSAAGLMSAADKKKLDGIATGAQVNPTVTSATITNGTLYKYGRVVTLVFNGSVNTSTTVQLPAGYYPAVAVSCITASRPASNAIVYGTAVINTSGVLSFRTAMQIATSTMSIITSYPAEFSITYISAS